jgi:tetratricopeptide (TPR) repeat protein
MDPALTTIATWSRDDVLAALARAPRSDVALLARALVLHTDIAMVEHATADTRPVDDSVGATLLIDGQDAGPAGRSAQWEIGRALAGVLRAQPGGEPIARLWYRATGALLQQWGDCAALRLHVEAGQAALESDAVLALYDGTRHQLYADPRVQAYGAGARRATGSRGMLVMGDGMNSGTLADSGTFAGYARQRTGGRLIDEDVMKPGSRHPFAPQAPAIELDAAERELRRALLLDPRLTEATVRLAHVLLAKGRAQEAAGLVRPLTPPALPPFLDFYAALVLGRSAEKLGQAAEARSAYERAVARFPNAQSARIALSRVVVADGRTADGLQSVVAVVGPTVTPGIDPWSAYFRFHDPDASTLLAELKAATR